MSNKKRAQKKSPPGARISLCMIVKNEEARLGAALDSAAPWVDEMVVVDTGSEDGTVELARSRGAKVLQRTWQGDFSLHRNQSLEAATGDWVLVLDADETLEAATAPRLRELAARPGPPGYLLTVHNRAGGEFHATAQVARFFKNLPRIRYRGIIHEQPTLPQSPQVAGVNIFHSGYDLDSAAQEAKAAQRLPMLREATAKNPDDFMAWVHLAKGFMGFGPGREKEALEAGLNALDIGMRLGLAPGELIRAVNPALSALAALESWAEFFSLAQTASGLIPSWPDPVLAQVIGAVKLHRWQEACSCARRFLALQKAYKLDPAAAAFSLNVTMGREKTALANWAAAACHLGWEDEAGEVFRRLLAEPGGDRAAKELVAELQRDGLGEAAQRLAAEGQKRG